MRSDFNVAEEEEFSVSNRVQLYYQEFSSITRRLKTAEGLIRDYSAKLHVHVRVLLTTQYTRPPHTDAMAKPQSPGSWKFPGLFVSHDALFAA